MTSVRQVVANKLGFNPLAWLQGTLKLRRLIASFPKPEPKRDARRFLVVVNPWIGSGVPFFSLTTGLLLAARGQRVTFAFDDMPFGQNQLRFRFISRCIRACIKQLAPDYDTIVLSEHRSAAALDRDDALMTERFAEWNTIWALRGEMDPAGRKYFAERCKHQLTTAASVIKDIDLAGKFDVLFVPGGIYGTSGIWTARASAAGLRIASFDNAGYGGLMLAAQGIACQMHDIPRAFQSIKADCSDPEKRKFVVDTAETELQKRKSGTDTFRSQIKAGRTDNDWANGAIMIALNSSWDSSALGLHAIFKNSTEWLLTTVAYLLDNTAATVLVRQHPAERLDYARTTDNYRELLDQHFGSHPRLRFIAAEDPVNSYDLLDRIGALVVYTSTIGVEATIYGKPVITPSKSYYAQMGFVWRAATISQYQEILSQAAIHRLIVSPEMRNDALICYYATQCHNWVFTPFNPADMRKWVRMTEDQLMSDKGVQVALTSLIDNIPVALINHANALHASSIAAKVPSNP